MIASSSPVGPQRPIPVVSRPQPPLGVLVFVVGAAALGIEIAAVRLLAPYFGASMIIWANTIGVVLVALSAGYWWGGRLADRWPSITKLCAVVMTAALFTALLPLVARPALDVGVDALESIAAGAFIASLIATLALIAVPVLLLGTVAPWALRLGIDGATPAGVGTLAGRLYALSTLGSLIGTLATALFLVPTIGTRRTFLFFALLLSIVAWSGLRKRRVTILAPLAIAAMTLVPPGSIKDSASYGSVIFETETDDQYVRVVERPDRSRVLELNEGLAVHSLYRPETVLTDNIWDAPLLLPFAARTTIPKRIAILGNGAGTVARAYGEYFPETYVDGVELDAELTKIGRRYFALDNPRFSAFHEDARPFLRRTDRRYDVILVDAYRQPYIPFYLTTREFFTLAKTRLNPGGVVLINIGHPEGSDKLESVISATLKSVFQNVARDPTEPTNTMMIASQSKISARKLRSAAKSFDRPLRSAALADAAILAPPLSGGDVYTDDLAPVESLIDRSIVSYAADGSR